MRAQQMEERAEEFMETSSYFFGKIKKVMNL